MSALAQASKTLTRQAKGSAEASTSGAAFASVVEVFFATGPQLLMHLTLAINPLMQDQQSTLFLQACQHLPLLEFFFFARAYSVDYSILDTGVLVQSCIRSNECANTKHF